MTGLRRQRDQTGMINQREMTDEKKINHLKDHNKKIILRMKFNKIATEINTKKTNEKKIEKLIINRSRKRNLFINKTKMRTGSQNKKINSMIRNYQNGSFVI